MYISKASLWWWPQSVFENVLLSSAKFSFLACVTCSQLGKQIVLSLVRSEENQNGNIPAKKMNTFLIYLKSTKNIKIQTNIALGQFSAKGIDLAT